jgi:hypothetical protein
VHLKSKCWDAVAGRAIDPAKLIGVLAIKPYTNATTVCQFTDICNYFSTYIKDYADISEPLVCLMRKDVPFIWTKLWANTFELLKLLLTTAPVLTIADLRRPFHVHTDASAFALGAVFPQENLSCRGEFKPIWYASHLLLSAEKNYTTTEQECLAVVWARKKFRYYLEGNEWTCATDHMALIKQSQEDSRYLFQPRPVCYDHTRLFTSRCVETSPICRHLVCIHHEPITV